VSAILYIAILAVAAYFVIPAIAPGYGTVAGTPIAALDQFTALFTARSGVLDQLLELFHDFQLTLGTATSEQTGEEVIDDPDDIGGGYRFLLGGGSTGDYRTNPKFA